MPKKENFLQKFVTPQSDGKNCNTNKVLESTALQILREESNPAAAGSERRSKAE